MVASPAEKPPIMLAVTKLTLIMGLKLWEEWRWEKQQAAGDGEAAERPRHSSHLQCGLLEMDTLR